MNGKRVFDIDIAHCPHCGGQLKLIAAIEEPAAIARIFTYLVLDAACTGRAGGSVSGGLRRESGLDLDRVGEMFGPSAFNRQDHVQIYRGAAQSCLRC